MAADRLPDPAQKALQTWVGRIKEAEREDAALFGLTLPGDSSLAVVLVGMEEAAYAGDPEFDSRVPVSAAVSPAEPPPVVQFIDPPETTYAGRTGSVVRPDLMGELTALADAFYRVVEYLRTPTPTITESEAAEIADAALFRAEEVIDRGR